MRWWTLWLLWACQPDLPTDEASEPRHSDSEVTHDDEPDSDNNGCIDALESSLLGALLDSDDDGEADLCDDADGDGCPDVLDPAPTEAGEDADGDFIADECDVDDDNDGCRDDVDPHPLMPDPDDDGDGIPTVCDHDVLTIPFSPTFFKTVLSTPGGDRAVGGGSVGRWVQIRPVGSTTGILPVDVTNVRDPLGNCDVDGDGWEELFVGAALIDARTGGVRTQLSEPVAGGGDAACVDLDGDGDLEILLHDADGLQVWDHRGVLLQALSVPSSMSGLAVGQMDADPALEVVTRDRSVWDSGTWEVQGLVHPDFVEVQLYDVDGDGIDEVLGRQRPATWYMSDERITQWFSPAGGRLVPGDFDGDGRTEVVIHRVFPDPQLTVLDGATGEPRFDPISSPACVEWFVEDGDQDGRALLWCQGLEDRVAFDPATGLFVTVQEHTSRHTRPSLGDLDGDGVPEVIWTADPDTGLPSRVIVRDLEGTWLDQLVLAPLQVAEVWDIDDDGDVEIVTGIDAWNWSLETGWQEASSPLPLANASHRSFGLTDVDGNGFPDVMLGTRSLGRWAVFSVDLGSSQQQDLLTRTSITAWDLDDDGELEFIGPGSTFESDGTPMTAVMGRAFVDRSQPGWVSVDDRVQWRVGLDVLASADLPRPRLEGVGTWASDGALWSPYALGSTTVLMGVSPTGVTYIDGAVRGHGVATPEVVWIGDTQGAHRYIRR